MDQHLTSSAPGRPAGLPGPEEMYRALVDRDPSFEGVFVAAIRTTGIFCRPTCGARKPRSENVEFYSLARDALFAGFRPCLRCRPLEPAGIPPAWLRGLLADVEADPARRWTDADLLSRALDPGSVRRWFQKAHGMTFHAYVRGRRLGKALGALREGEPMVDVGLDHGWESLSGFRDAIARLAGEPPGRARAMRPVPTARILTPLGPMVAAAVDEGICLLEFADRRMLPLQFRRLARHVGGVATPGHHPHLVALEAELHAWFAGELQAFTVPTIAQGTPFQEACWRWLRMIPYGETRTYLDGATATGRPEAVRAFASAVGDNRLAILIPCHRVVGSDGRLTGYGGGLWRKQRMLDLERAGRATPAPTLRGPSRAASGT